MPGQLGLEATPQEYVGRLVSIFEEVRRILRSDGTLWLNLGDSYNAYNGNAGPGSGFSRGAACDTERPKLSSGHGLRTKTLKPKDLVGIPWRVAFALQETGWYLRSDIVWHKPNPMPESVTDRPTKSHEYIFLLSKSQQYYYDSKRIQEPAIGGKARGGKNAMRGQGHFREGAGPANRAGRDMKHVGASGKWSQESPQASGRRMVDNVARARANGASHDSPFGAFRNRRSVWTIPTKPFKGAHFATFPEALIEPCILAGCPVGGTVLDPFAGSGTTGKVALDNGRYATLIELNPDYVKLIKGRVSL